MRRKVFIAVGGLILLLIGFAVGAFASFHFWSKTFQTSTLEEATINLMQAETKMEQLDRGDFNGLRTSLNMAIDVEVIRIYQALDSSSNENKIQQAKKTLARVAKHRQLHPPAYPDYSENQNKENVIKYVESVLNEYVKQ